MTIPLYEQILGYVLDQIRAGRWQPGDRVPSEKELAAQFGVSRITSKKALEQLVHRGVVERVRGRGSFVSRVLPDLSQVETSARGSSAVVEQAARPPARRLIGLLLPDFSEVYGLSLLRAIEERCTEQDMALVLKRSYGRSEEEERAIQSLCSLGVDGLIVFPVHGEYYNDALLRLVLADFPLVLVDRYLTGIAASAVYTDNKAAARELTAHLLIQGHARLAFLSPPMADTSSIEERYEGFLAALAEQGLTPGAAACLSELRSTLPQAFHEPEICSDEQAIQSFLTANPEVTAVVASEYNVALLVADVLARLGKRIPEDCAVVCFDSPEAPFGTPAFTHIQQDETAMGRAAVDLLLARLSGDSTTPRQVVPFRLVEGRSSRPLASTRV